MGILIACTRRSGRKNHREWRKICANMPGSQNVIDDELLSKLSSRFAFLHHARELHTAHGSLDLSHPAPGARILLEFLTTVDSYVYFPTKTRL